MPCSHHSDQTVSEQRLCPHLRSSCVVHDTSLQVDVALAKRVAVLVCLLQEAQPDARSVGTDALEEAGSEGLHESLARPQRECSDELLDVDLVGGPKHRLCVLHELADPRTKL